MLMHTLGRNIRLLKRNYANLYGKLIIKKRNVTYFLYNSVSVEQYNFSQGPGNI